jgi:hypothetical protein
MKLPTVVTFAAGFLALHCAGPSDPPDPALRTGHFEARFVRHLPEDSVSAEVRFDVRIAGDLSGSYDMYWNGHYAKGAAGTWSGRDTAWLQVATCYKGFQGAKRENDCSEDFPGRRMALLRDAQGYYTYGEDRSIIRFREK